MYILGISAFYHDSAACLIKDGEIVSAVQEERFTRKKHDSDFPKNAVAYCLNEAGISSSNIDYVVFYEKPLVKFERILETYVSYVPLGIKSFIKAMPVWMKQKLWISDIITRELDYKGKILFTEHHEAHAASAFFPSPFKDAAILTVDGVGEWTTASYGIGQGNNIKILAEIKFPHSLGLLYSAFTYYTGFRVNSGEYKVMGLAPYGEPKYVDIIYKELIDLKPDGSFRLNMKYFDYCAGLTMTNSRFNKLFGGPPRKPESKITQKEMDIARSIQEVTEEIMIRMTKHIYKETGMKKLCLAGGVALNCVANGRILREVPFENIWVQPSAGDAGAALGAALFVWHQYLGNPRAADEKTDFQKGSYLGPACLEADIGKYLDDNNIPYKKFDDKELVKYTAKLLTEENVVGWVQGRMEFGPRALGARSILGDPRSEKMQSIMNLKIKFRESFRPFAPSAMLEKTKEWFDLHNYYNSTENLESPYMLLVTPVKRDKRIQIQNINSEGLDKLKISRSKIPAVTHVDYSARVQTVKRQDNPLYYDLINAFYDITGVPLLINTSFNIRGEPIVCSVQDSYRCFMQTHMDYLVVGNYVLDKKEQPQDMSKKLPKICVELD
jgi:carbamoyltransferase